MKPRREHPLPVDREALLRRAVRLEVVTLIAMGLVAVMMLLSAGQSQAMKTAWIEDVLSLVPPVAFLVSARFARRPPDDEYVNGRARAFDVAFLVSAVALVGVGMALVADSLHSLLSATHPTIGSIRIGDWLIWQGWVMMAALLLSCVPPVILGRMKLPIARELSLKSLHTDADTGKADWMTGLAGLVGVAAIGLGWWWADAVAALVISTSVLRDGGRNLLHAIRDMHDARPETVERGRSDPLVDDIDRAVRSLPWVASCDLRLHEEGMRICGVIEVRSADEPLDPARLPEVEAAARRVSWRLDDITVTVAAAAAADGRRAPREPRLPDQPMA